jgi:hypothetical protein
VAAGPQWDGRGRSHERQRDMPRMDADIDLTKIDPEQAFEAFASAFRVSRRGRFWRVWDGLVLTVFRDKFGRWCWCIADSDGPRFSRSKFSDAECALLALWRQLEGVA